MLVGMTDELDRLAARAVADLDWHWGSAYVITHTADGMFHAMRRALPATCLTAATPDELRTLIRADYDARTHQ